MAVRALSSDDPGTSGSGRLTADPAQMEVCRELEEGEFAAGSEVDEKPLELWGKVACPWEAQKVERMVVEVGR